MLVQPQDSPSPDTTQIRGPALDEPSSPRDDNHREDFAMDEEAMNLENNSPRSSIDMNGGNNPSRLSIDTFENYQNDDHDDEPSRASLQKSVSEKTVLGTLKRTSQKKTTRISKHGLKYKSLPLGVVKKLAMNMARSGASKGDKLSRDALDAVMQATDWFFEQISDDLGTYSEHAGRKTIDQSDVLMLMKRYFIYM